VAKKKDGKTKPVEITGVKNEGALMRSKPKALKLTAIAAALLATAYASVVSNDGSKVPAQFGDLADKAARQSELFMSFGNIVDLADGVYDAMGTDAFGPISSALNAVMKATVFSASLEYRRAIKRESVNETDSQGNEVAVTDRRDLPPPPWGLGPKHPEITSESVIEALDDVNLYLNAVFATHFESHDGNGVAFGYTPGPGGTFVAISSARDALERNLERLERRQHEQRSKLDALLTSRKAERNAALRAAVGQAS
jgi:hypothetical protein